MTQIKAVLFDYGMVLSAHAHPPAWERMKSLTGQDEATFQASYWARRHEYDRGDLTGRQYWRTVSPPSDDPAIDQLILADIDLWTQPNQPMLDWAAALQRAGIRTGVLSNIGDEMERGVRSIYDFTPFDHCTWSHALNLAKPDPLIYAHAVAGLATPAGQILFIDDRADNIQAARESGLETLQYSTHPAFEAEMRSRGMEYLLHP